MLAPVAISAVCFLILAGIGLVSPKDWTPELKPCVCLSLHCCASQAVKVKLIRDGSGTVRGSCRASMQDGSVEWVQGAHGGSTRVCGVAFSWQSPLLGRSG